MNNEPNQICVTIRDDGMRFNGKMENEVREKLLKYSGFRGVSRCGENASKLLVSFRSTNDAKKVLMNLNNEMTLSELGKCNLSINSSAPLSSVQSSSSTITITTTTRKEEEEEEKKCSEVEEKNYNFSNYLFLPNLNVNMEEKLMNKLFGDIDKIRSMTMEKYCGCGTKGTERRFALIEFFNEKNLKKLKKNLVRCSVTDCSVHCSCLVLKDMTRFTRTKDLCNTLNGFIAYHVNREERMMFIFFSNFSSLYSNRKKFSFDYEIFDCFHSPSFREELNGETFDVSSLYELQKDDDDDDDDDDEKKWKKIEKKKSSKRKHQINKDVRINMPLPKILTFGSNIFFPVKLFHLLGEISIMRLVESRVFNFRNSIHLTNTMAARYILRLASLLLINQVECNIMRDVESSSRHYKYYKKSSNEKSDFHHNDNEINDLSSRLLLGNEIECSISLIRDFDDNELINLPKFIGFPTIAITPDNIHQIPSMSQVQGNLTSFRHVRNYLKNSSQIFHLFQSNNLDSTAINSFLFPLSEMSLQFLYFLKDYIKDGHLMADTKNVHLPSFQESMNGKIGLGKYSHFPYVVQDCSRPYISTIAEEMVKELEHNKFKCVTNNDQTEGLSLQQQLMNLCENYSFIIFFRSTFLPNEPKINS
ncbi:hypothetical protein SNEBB_004660 [Seison nebaliae]|nr:hypothetical protein SNEBB_004660 [Seison nebaliae]